MPTSPLEISHKTLFKSTVRSVPASTHSTSIPNDPNAGPWPESLLPTSEHLEPHEWAYLAEGGKSLLVRFDGDVDAARNGWVNHNATKALALRLSKKPRGQDSVTTSEPPTVDRDAFEKQVAGPLLGSQSLVPISKQIALPRHGGSGGDTFLHRIAARIEMQRPRERRAVDGIDVDADHIEILEDLSWSAASAATTLGVEIKPKWLFASGSDGVSRYRRHQILRNPALSRQDFDMLYEPLDLVSGNEERVRRATQGLVQNWQAGGNNLRLFSHGKVVDAGDSSAVQSLLKSLGNGADVVETLTRTLTPILVSPPFQRILNRLAQLQSTLSPMDLESLSAWYAAQTRTEQPFAHHKELSSAPTLQEFTSYAQDWLALRNNNDSTDPQIALTLRQALVGALLSATFKDCSLFLRLTPNDGNSTVVASQHVQAETVTAATEGQQHTHAPYLSDAGSTHDDQGGHRATTPLGYTVKVIDVDPKPIHKLPRWLQLERDIDQAYGKWAGEKSL